MSTIDHARPLVITDEQAGTTTVVRCAGEIDIATVPYLRDRLQQLQIDGPSDLVIELEQVTFIDSVGLGALIGAHKRARVLQGTFTIVCTCRPVLRVLSATALDRVFRVVPTMDEALASIDG
ncbi:STAS domain-containing protein [Nocardioides sp. CN2-186]|uniref:STAS domain-containing protein n=1 Tax=Nocardioides tweenelious TaxID=3156607 RepID=UPI0032B57812